VLISVHWPKAISHLEEKKPAFLLYSYWKCYHVSEASVEINEYPFMALYTYGENV